MHVALLSEFFIPECIGGIEINTYYFAKELAKHGDEVTVFTTTKKPKNYVEGFEIKNLNELRVEPHFYGLNEKYFALHVASSLKKKAQDFDIFHSQDCRTTLPLTLEGSLLKKSVATISNFWPFCGQGYKFLLKDYSICTGCTPKNLSRCLMVNRANHFLRPIHSYFYLKNANFGLAQFNRLRKTVCVSNFLADLLEKHTGKHSQTIYNPVDDQWLLDKKIPYGTGNILFAGRLVEWKGIAQLLKAFSLVLAERKCKLLLAGSPNSFYKKMAVNFGVSNNVLFLGPINHFEMKEVYKNSDVVVLPSLTMESFGRTLAEAMALQKPVIGTQVGAIPELVEDGVNGFLVKPNDPLALADRISTILNDISLQKKMGKKGRVFAKRTCSAKVIISKYRKIYRSLLNEPQ